MSYPTEYVNILLDDSHQTDFDPRSIQEYEQKDQFDLLLRRLSGEDVAVSVEGWKTVWGEDEDGSTGD